MFVPHMAHIFDCGLQRLRKWLLVSNLFGTDHRTKIIKIIFETTLEANLLDKKLFQLEAQSAIIKFSTLFFSFLFSFGERIKFSPVVWTKSLLLTEKAS